MNFKTVFLFVIFLASSSFAVNYTMESYHIGLAALIGPNGTMGTLTNQQPSTANSQFNSITLNIGGFPALAGGTSGYIFVQLPQSWTIEPYQPNSNISVNWTSSLNSSFSFNVSIYDENNTFITSIVNSTPFYNALWFNATPDGFYYARVTSCNGSICVTNTSAVFGVFTPTITIGFGASAIPDGVTINDDNYTEYCDYSFYPGRTAARAGAVNFFTSNSSIFKVTYTNTPGPSGTDVPFAFNNMVSGEFGRFCYGVNIYNSSVDGAIRQIRFITSTAIPFNTIDTFLIISLLILLIFLATSMSNIKVVGVVGGILLLLLGMWVITDNLFYKVGVSGLKYQTNEVINNITTNTTIIGSLIYVNDSSVNRYQEIQVPIVGGTAGIKAKDILGFSIILIALYAIMHYAQGIFGTKQVRRYR